MAAETTNAVSQLVDRIVGEAARNGRCVLLSKAIGEVWQAFPDSGLSERYVTSVILIAATSAMVAVEMDRRESLAR